MSVIAVVPLPSSVEETSSASFALSETSAITGDATAAADLAGLIAARTGLDVPFRAAAHGTTIDLRIARSEARESYRIAVDAASVVVTGADAAGLFYGVQTLGQLITADGDDYAIPAVRIEDAPRFAYRGVMLDVARHFFPVETVLAYIDRAAGMKFNALHLHLTDDQGWRIQLDSRPRLTELASATAVGGDSGGFYSKADYRTIVAYAASRHMIVVPELDLPGHTHAVGLAYPDIAEDPALSDHILEIARDHGGASPTAGIAYDGVAVGFSSLKIHSEATYDFVADVVGELVAMTPGPYIHVGGDEALGTDPAAFSRFMARATAIVADLGKTPITWHEAGGAAGIVPGTVGQYWGFTIPTEGMDDKARAFAARDGRVILSPSDAVYLDMKYDPSATLGLAWANGPTSVERAYSWDPATTIVGIDDDAILGVEAPLWTETIRTLDDIDEMVFPRIAAAAEIAWSPAPSQSPLRTWDSFRARVGTLAPLWSGLGIRFHPSDEIAWSTE